MNLDELTFDEASKQALAIAGISEDVLASLPDGAFRVVRVSAEFTPFLFGAEAEIAFFYGRDGHVGSTVTISAIAEYGLPGGDGTLTVGLAFGDGLDDFGGVALEPEGSYFASVSYVRPWRVPQGELGPLAVEIGAADWANTAVVTGFAQTAPAGFIVFEGGGSDIGAGVELGYTFVIPKQPTPEGSFWELEGLPADPSAIPPTINQILQQNINSLSYAHFVAAGMRVHNDCLHANETILQDSFELLPDGTGYSIAAINSITGLVTTINHTVAGNPVDGIITDIGETLISRQTHIPSIDSFLNQELTFGDDNTIIPGGWSFQNNEFSHQFGDLPGGLVVVAGGPIDYPSDGVFGQMSDYDPIQDLGLAGLDEAGEPWGATSFGDMNWYGLADPNDGSVVTTIGYHQPETPPPDPVTGEAAPTLPAQVFIRQQDTTGSSMSFSDAFIVGGETAANDNDPTTLEKAA